MNRILLTVRLCQDDESRPLHNDKAWDRQFWVATKTDLAWAFDTIEIEAHKLFEFADEGVAETFTKEGDHE